MSGEAADATRAQAAVDPGDHSGLERWSQSRAPAAPIWRLGVPCEGSVRDPIRLAALTRRTRWEWPSGLGMETEAQPRPPDGASTGGGRLEKNGGASHAFGSQRAERPLDPRSGGRSSLLAGDLSIAGAAPPPVTHAPVSSPLVQLPDPPLAE